MKFKEGDGKLWKAKKVKESKRKLMAIKKGSGKLWKVKES